MVVAAGILVGAYVLIFSERLHRTIAALGGAVIMVVVGEFAGFYEQEQALGSVDGNTMLLLLGMMLLVALVRPTGGFEYLAIRLAKLSAASPRRLLMYLSLAVSILSMFLDNVTTVIIFAPLTVLITRMLNLNPAPFLMAEAMLSNIGGASTLVGDPPNIMIGSAAGLDFNAFLYHLLPVIIPVWLITVGLMLILFREDLKYPAGGLAEARALALDLDETKAIKDPAVLRHVMLAMGIVIGLFFVHHHLHLYPAFVAFIGLGIALALVRPDPEDLLKQAEWPVLLFFAALFVLVGGVEASGLLDLIGEQLAHLARDPSGLLLTALLLMWVAALVSAVVDNIPFTVTMIPIVAGLQAKGLPVEPLWWALAIGVGLGGNGTHIGATANIICVAEAERSGIDGARISPMRWLRVGLPAMLLSLMVASLVYAALYEWLFA
ncbi:ArsB/NhaD family transporter [Thiohalocapsa marina]|uniref:ArsB/NhaD family transporter n=2 Tax=Thiohalocapsa marina TaxID=424902 RepID=A0A5M8FBF7_9GAMM|nr:ArsB/NhaD family transporter [Thiohalocapsa marina]